MIISKKQTVLTSLILGFLSGLLILIADMSFRVHDPWWILIPAIIAIVGSVIVFLISSEMNTGDRIINSLIFLILYSGIHWLSTIIFWLFGIDNTGM